jgi:glycosyltransferase involved in cell wall biosynthesis
MTPMENVKVALVHDWLTGQRGGEKVLEVLAEIFPKAPIYTLFHIKGSQHPDIEKRVIRTSFLQRMPFLDKKYRSYLPLFPMAIEMFDLQEYDLVVSTSHCVAKGAIPRPDALHVCYIHSPMRYAWNLYFSYFASDRLSPFSRWLIPPVIHRLRTWDAASAARVDRFVANSANVARRVGKYYRRAADVIPPPVDTEFYRPSDSVVRGDYHLVVSALVPYKRIDLAVEAFSRTGAPLKIVGTGPEYRALRKRARANVEFLGAAGAGDLRRLYQGAVAFLLPGEEDFGIATLEAQACGTPVIAYGRGGSLETVVSGETGLLFDEPTVAGLLGALDKFRTFACNRETIRSNAMRFSREKFKEGISSCLRKAWAERGAPA